MRYRVTLLERHDLLSSPDLQEGVFDSVIWSPLLDQCLLSLKGLLLQRYSLPPPPPLAHHTPPNIRQERNHLPVPRLHALYRPRVQIRWSCRVTHAEVQPARPPRVCGPRGLEGEHSRRVKQVGARQHEGCGRPQGDTVQAEEAGQGEGCEAIEGAGIGTCWYIDSPSRVCGSWAALLTLEWGRTQCEVCPDGVRQ